MAQGVAIPPFIRVWIRRAYETNPHMTIEEIARHAGCTASAVSRMARREGWSRAPGAVRAGRAEAGPAAAAPPSPPGVSPASPTAERRMLLDALWLIASRHVAELQSAGVAPGPDGAHERAHGVQTLMTVVRTVEKLMEMEAEAASAAPAYPDEGPADIDEFRNEIARRLEGLLASRMPG